MCVDETSLPVLDGWLRSRAADELLWLASSGFKSFFPNDQTAVGLIKQNRILLRIHTPGQPSPQSDQIRVSSSDIIAAAVRSGRPAHLAGSAHTALGNTVADAAGFSGGETIVVPAVSAAGEIVGLLYVQTVGSPQLTRRDKDLVGTLAGHLGACLSHIQLQARHQKTFLQTISALSAIVETKDDYTEDHCHRIAEMALSVGLRLGLSQERLDMLNHASILHDIGKIGVPDTILQKPSTLTADEFDLMKQHTTFGRHIVEKIGPLQKVGPIIEQHHERYDGTGYPLGLSGDDILLEARIITVVDAFDAMRSTRPYRRALPIEHALRELDEGTGTQFDPSVVQAFYRHLGLQARLS